MLTLTFLGVGSAFAKRNYQSNALLEAWTEEPDKQAEPDEVVLVDFGTTGPASLHELKTKPGFQYLDANGATNYPALRRILITHEHFDHIGGLQELALMNMFVYTHPQTGKPFKPQLISATNILNNLWDHSLKGGLNTIRGRFALLQDYFFILALTPGDPAHDRFQILKRYSVRLFPTDHVQIERKYDFPSYGFVVEDSVTGESAYFSGDTRLDWDVTGDMMLRARICFHDVQLIRHRAPHGDYVHAVLDDLQTMPEEVRRKTWLYHYSDNWDTPDFDGVRQEFAGFAPQHRRITILS